MFGLTLAREGRASSQEITRPLRRDNRGTNLLNARRYREAIPHFDEAIRLNPRYADAYHNRGVAYKILGNTSVRSRTTTSDRFNPRMLRPTDNRGPAISKALGNSSVPSRTTMRRSESFPLR